MDMLTATGIVVRHPYLRTQMGNLFPDSDMIVKISQKDFEAYYIQFVEAAVEVNPELLED